MQGRELVGIIFVTAALLLSSGCQNGIRYKNPEFAETLTGSFEILSGDLGYGRVSDMFICGKYAVLLTPDRTDDTCLQIFDKDTGVRLRGAVHKGRGPREVTVGMMLSAFDRENGNVLMYEQWRHAMVICNIDKLMAGDIDAIYENGRLIPNAMRTHYPLDNGHTLLINNVSPVTRDTTKISRFTLCDLYDNVLSCNDSYPYPENSYFRWHLYMFAVSGMSPRRDKLAIGTSYGAVLETYDISDNAVKNRSTSYFIEPRIGNEKQFTNDDTVLGFNDIYAADDFIYAAYDGKNKGDVAPSKFFHNIAVFDWDSRPLKIFDMGMRVEHLCQDPETGLMYAVVEDADRNCHLARCDLNVK